MLEIDFEKHLKVPEYYSVNSNSFAGIQIVNFKAEFGENLSFLK